MGFRRNSRAIDPPRRKRRSRRAASFRKVDLKRAIDGAKKVGLEIGSVDIRPDGTITIRTVSGEHGHASGIFDQWEDRL